MDAGKYLLSEEEHQRVFEEKIIPYVFDNVSPPPRGQQPVAVIFGGQPGAGKSASVKTAQHEFGAACINGDEFRDYHKDYSRLMREDDKTAAFYTDRDTGKWIEKAIAEAKNRGVNVVIEGTMRRPEAVARTMRDFRAAGYKIDARALAVNSCLSKQGILQRYEKQKADRGAGRMTTHEAHQAACDGMPITLDYIEKEKLSDRISIYRRGNELVFCNELKDGKWQKDTPVRKTLESERNRAMTLRECRDYAQGYDTLASLLKRPERQASADEIGRVDALRRQAKAELTELAARENPGRKTDRG